MILRKRVKKIKIIFFFKSFGEKIIKFPTGMAVHGNQLIICEYGDNRLSIFDISSDKFEWKKYFPQATPRAPVKPDEGGKDLLNSPWGLYVLFNELFVVDSCNHQLQVFH